MATCGICGKDNLGRGDSYLCDGCMNDDTVMAKLRRNAEMEWSSGKDYRNEAIMVEYEGQMDRIDGR